MRAINAQKKIEKSADVINANKNGNIRLRGEYKLVLNALQSGNKTIRPCWVSGRGRHIQNVDYTFAVCHLLKVAGIRYELTNDAPRGGLTGNLITLTHIEY